MCYETATANSFETVVFAIPSSAQSQLTNPIQLDASISFQLSIRDKIQTLSTTNAGRRSRIRGLLYVPELDPGDPCGQTTSPYIPANVTRLSDLPNLSRLISIAPWVSSECTVSFLAAQSRNSPLAAVFYHPDASTEIPPPEEDVIWDLGDSGMWKSRNNYPVYAIPGAYGALVMRALNDYSGNLTDVPYGEDLIRTFQDDKLLIRMYSRIGLKNVGSSLPSLWIFLLAVLGVLISLVLFSSITMRSIQIKRRHSLERRVAAGEVDLEKLGIKRLNVPQNTLDRFPLYVYDDLGRPELLTSSTSELTPDAPECSKLHLDRKKDTFQAISRFKWIISALQAVFTRNPQLSSPPRSNAAVPPSPKLCTMYAETNQQNSHPGFSQMTCPICLEDYVNGESRVRELPCRHIFHPECIDSFLLQNSSLCPFCKMSVLPRGYCPEKITDAMVRQERAARRIRQERAAQNGDAGYDMTMPTFMENQNETSRERATGSRSAFRNSVSNMLRYSRNGAHVTSSDDSTSPQRHDNTRSSLQRQEEMRMRAMAMLGDHPMLADEERSREASRPKCKLDPNIPLRFTLPLARTG
ncbi:hypothetical protein AJ79_00136 [Helicocarpus griseus UAMH5409]|uniref:RING-type domain-containing protein n=1 Tax=Helicocarpus griseus UAMH5409 TaxID=1447875 RepID=A0A2B7YE00_9EURO|nr:hypothetical protein AJ79_00136 [Helicocarpus griseus UAMH5409]